jgi:hypothetical protein
MHVSVRSYLASGLATITTGAVIVVAPAEAPPEPDVEMPPVALAAQVQPLQLPAPAALGLSAPTALGVPAPRALLPSQPPALLPAQLPALVAQQLSFNTGVAVDFIVTGAQLIGRQVEVALTLADDIRNGTPVPAALGRAVVSVINIELDAGRELVGFARELANFQIQFLGNLVSELPAVIAEPAGRALALSADAVDTVSDVANRVLDRLSRVSTNVTVAQSQPRQTSRPGAFPRPDNAMTLRRDNVKSSAVERDSTNAAISSAGDTARRFTHTLRDAVRRSVSTSASNTADKPDADGEHRQRHRRDRQQDNSADGDSEHGNEHGNAGN